MNDFDPTLDELVSAYLDGEATGDEVARVEQSAELRARASALGAVRDAVAAPVTAAPTGHREQAIEAALRASNTAANVTSLAARQARSARVLRIASVAAVVAVFMLAGSLILLNRDSNDQTDAVASGDTAATDTDTLQSAADESAGAMEAPAAEPVEEPAAALAEETMSETAADEAPQPATEAPASAEEAAPVGPEFVARLTIEPQTDTRGLAEVLLMASALDDGDGSLDARAPLSPCTAAFLETVEGVVLGFAETTLNGVDVGAVASVAPEDFDVRIVAIFELDAPACTAVSVERL